MNDIKSIVERARALGLALPAFNIPYLPMMRSVIRALRDTGTFALIQVARLEWEKFESRSLEAVREEYERLKDDRLMRLHLDHVPVVDEDGLEVDYLPILRRALDAGFDSVMVDGSRLPFDANVAATRAVIDLAHARGTPVEAELGAVLGHEAGPLPPYEELFASGRGFTEPEDAERFVALTGVDWLSVSIGNIHGAIAGAAKSQKKPEARLDLARLSKIAQVTGVPIVLHGGTGIKPENLREGMKRGICKINIGTAIRAPYEATMGRGAAAADEAVYAATLAEIASLGLEDSAQRLFEGRRE
ncbi:MAG TPA: class II fructose-bisphosphate aldolase [Rectinemataceae bacterium]|nr:class II fructose-bisphosphate aldolase [Rectinemataceae bacterium]